MGFFFSLEGARVQRTARMPMGGWEEEPVAEDGSEDELPPHVHKVEHITFAVPQSAAHFSRC